MKDKELAESIREAVRLLVTTVKDAENIGLEVGLSYTYTNVLPYSVIGEYKQETVSIDPGNIFISVRRVQELL